MATAPTDETCFWCKQTCGGTCLNLTNTQMRPDDPAYWMLSDGRVSTPVVYRAECYICRDPEYAQMGLPLCRKCEHCGGHIAADDTICDDCGAADEPTEEEIRAAHGAPEGVS